MGTSCCANKTGNDCYDIRVENGTGKKGDQYGEKAIEKSGKKCLQDWRFCKKDKCHVDEGKRKEKT